MLPIALAVIMVSLGMNLTTADFRRVVVYPKGMAIGLANLLILSPLLAFAVAEVYNLEPALAVGLVLLGASPGGTLANLLTHLARGDTALSISMTALSSVAAVITVPLYLKLATSHFGASGLDTHVGVIGVVLRVLLITVVPLAIGMWLRARRPQRVAEVGEAFRKAAVVL
ncbi:MAG TPA: bile acid:sodium symporter, partial [Solirubrobacterales bacterium]|nr:bile acid:sodium symporter [Solirubrobacterales bacterium]